MTNQNLTFGAVLQRVRRLKGKKQRDVARDIGMDFSYFSRLENDRFDSKPTRETVERIADALGCTPDERSELLAAAGRIDEEIERVALKAGENPTLREFFRSASQLSNDRLKEYLNQIKAELSENTPAKPEED
jgi:HTH-type transcriptional regulator, competence development regulator